MQKRRIKLRIELGEVKRNLKKNWQISIDSPLRYSNRSPRSPWARSIILPSVTSPSRNTFEGLLRFPAKVVKVWRISLPLFLLL